MFCNRAQVVGWPPVRSFRKNTLASSNIKKNSDVEAKSGPGCIYVKVSLEGAPYLRKVDLKSYANYLELSSALQKMFSCFTVGMTLPLLPSLKYVQYISYFSVCVTLQLGLQSDISFKKMLSSFPTV